MAELEFRDSGASGRAYFRTRRRPPPHGSAPVENPRTNGLMAFFANRRNCLNAHWFLSLADAQEKLDAWRRNYNGQRPHGALKNLTPEEFVRATRGAPPWG